MELDKGRSRQIYQLIPSGKNNGFSGFIIQKSRLLIGRSETCDLIIPAPEVSAIHAVLEIGPNGGKIYDMNSKNGTFVNGQKVVSEKFSVNSILKFADYEFNFKNYVKDELPPVLSMLSPEKDSGPGKLETLYKEKKLDLPKNTPSEKKPVSTELPSVVYPLALDPKAEFSEYIFEDVETLFPIFKYDFAKQSIEVIILFQDFVYSVDYLPLVKKEIYYLAGVGRKDDDIEYPYLAKKDRFAFIEIINNEIMVNQPLGYEVFKLSDSNKKLGNSVSNSWNLSQQDILRFTKEDLQIYVRVTDAPPKIAAPPILRRDKDFQKYLLLCLLFAILFISGISIFEVDEELKKEEVPERIATILYKKDYVISKNESVAKTEKAPKVVQKSPVEKVVKKTEEIKTVAEKEQPKKVDDKLAGKKTNEPPKEVKQATTTKPTDDKLRAKSTPSKVASPSKEKNSSNQASKRAAKVDSNNKGNVDTYKAVDFTSTVSSLVSKGGATKGAAHAVQNDSGEISGGSQVIGGDSDSESLQRAKVSNNIGSLTGAASGKLETSSGAGGLVNKKTIYTAGMPSKTVVLGSMDPDIIFRILRDHIPQFRRCYEQELDKSSREFTGALDMNFQIGASGHVTKAGVDSKDLPADVKGCVVNVLKGIRFPEPMGGGVVEVKQPINFFPVVK